MSSTLSPTTSSTKPELVNLGASAYTGRKESFKVLNIDSMIRVGRPCHPLYSFLVLRRAVMAQYEFLAPCALNTQLPFISLILWNTFFGGSETAALTS